MQIILTDDVTGLGEIGETVNVKPGYARNFLIPRGLAIETQSGSAKAIEHRKRQIDSKKRRMKGSAEDLAKKLRSVAIDMELRVGSAGRVFGSVQARDIAEKLTSLGFETDRRRVLVADPIKRVGTHFVTIRLHSDVECQVKVNVIGVDASPEHEGAAVEASKAALEAAAAAREDEIEDETTDAEA